MSPVLLFLLLSAVSTPPGAPQPVRLSAEVGGDRAVVEIRDLEPEAATLAARRALGTLAMVERQLLTTNAEGSVGRLNTHAGQGVQILEGNFGRLLQSVLGFCLWSRGANGPLGGVLYDLWGTASLPPAGKSLEIAVRTAACQSLTLHPETRDASLAAGSRLDLRHFATGYAIDRAIRELRDGGASNIWIEYRSVMRGMGLGPNGKGWKVTLPMFPGMTETLDPVWLHDRALAVISTHRDRFRFGETSYPGFIDQRSGRPARGTVGTVVVSELALDAQAIGSTMVILGNREGQLRLGGVDPSPSILWLMGDGEGEPLLATYKWSRLRDYR